MIGYIHTIRNYRQLQRYRWSTHFTVHRCTHAPGFSVFTSRILTTDLSQSHYHFKSYIKSSLHRLIPFLTLFSNCQFRRLDSIQFLNSQAHIPADWRLETRLHWTASTAHFFITTLHGPRRKHIHSVIGKVCLQRRCIATEVTRLFLAYSLPLEYDYLVVA
jgi:hypothetical protein